MTETPDPIDEPRSAATRLNAPTERDYIRRCATCDTPIAPLQADWLIGRMPPRQWGDQHNNVAQFAPVRHEHSPTPLCACGHTAEQAVGTQPVRCGVFRCGCTQHPALEWSPSGSAVDWDRIGRDAHANGDPRFPPSNRQIRDALVGMPVGGGAAKIMQQFLDGWDAASAGPVETAVAIGPRDTQLLIRAVMQTVEDQDGNFDPDDILSTSQIETIERLRPFADLPIEELVFFIDPWDVIAIAVTAKELADRYGLANSELLAAIDRAHTHIHTDDDHDDVTDVQGALSQGSANHGSDQDRTN